MRRFSSEDKIASAAAERYFAAAWLKPEPPLSAAPGHHRIVWDMRSERPKSAGYDFSIAAVWGEDTPIEPDGILVPPGKYSTRLTVGGKSQTQSFTLRMDPRVHTTAEDLARQYDAAKQAQELMNLSFAALDDAKELQKRKPSAPGRRARLGKEQLCDRQLPGIRRVSGDRERRRSADRAGGRRARKRPRGFRAASRDLEGNSPLAVGEVPRSHREEPLA